MQCKRRIALDGLHYVSAAHVGGVKFEENGIEILIGSGITIVSVLIAVLSAIYARRSARSAKQSNDIGRLNSLLSLRVHYLDLLTRKGELAKEIGEMKGAEEAYRAIAHIDSRLREINDELEIYYGKVFNP